MIAAAIGLHAAMNLLGVLYEQGVFDGPGAVALRAALLLAVLAALFWPRETAARPAPPAPSA